jgi:YesN/AraC family two-component response regulator
MTDYAMPHLSGIELAQKILRIQPLTPIILTSGFIRPEDEKRALELGVREIMTKPASVKDMVRVLSDLFSFTK